MTDQEKQLKREINKLKKLFKPLLDKTTFTIAEGLISDAAFMRLTLSKLQIDIAINGCIEEYQNGANQSGIKESSSIKVYNNMIRSYNTVIKNLMSLLPDDLDDESKSSLEAFLNRN